ncbi:MAG: [FeFe] hydrogenase H-cluster radical SAM maturase HydG [Kiritimatiellae bacterium]|nr:[FeFe] hydrogenase H-cluster radical SAM maturase HydG [Kiritimatiellia bacterium]
MATAKDIRHFANAEDYTKHFIIQEEIDKYLPGGKHFIDDDLINRTLASADASPVDPVRIREILAKSEQTCETLTVEETAALMRVEDPGLFEEMRAAADRIKRKVYDNRIVMFAPLYMSNLCVNGCRYCGFREGNEAQKRRVLTMDELKEEIDVVAGRIGHKRLIAVYGEHPTTSTEYIAETIETCYARQVPAPRTGCKVGIRRVNVNAAPLPVADLKVLRSVGIGTFQVFQETYNRKLYEEMHPAWSVKGNYDWRTTCFHRCLEAGVDDVGLGVLYGLCDWRFELLATVMHARDLERWFNIGPHTLSFPRLEPASGTKVPEESPWLIDDETFARILVIARLSVPYTGMIVTARESAKSRDHVLDHGMTQLDCSSNIAIKGYSDFENEAHQEKERQQFMLGDNRSLDEMVRTLAARGTITSFCTAGYRCGRTGGCIMDALKTGREGKFCKINAVLTFREWLDDFASDSTREIGGKLIDRELAAIKEWLPRFYPTVLKQYEATCRGERDLFF